MNPQKKIGILTFQKTSNYGAQLQNYALQEYLKQFNALKIEVINYNNENINKSERFSKLSEQHGIKQIAKYFLQKRRKKKKWENFEDFRKKYINLTNEYTKENISQIEKKFDYFVVGSDQIWNTDITANDYNYMLDFVTDDCKKYSYAASIGMDTVPEEKQKEISSKIKKFQQINVREESAKKLLEKNEIKDVKTVIDPVFLVKKEEWINKLDLIPKSGKYIFVYMISNQKENMKKIKKFAQKEHLTIIYINDNPLNVFGVKNIRSASPKEFLEYIYGAQYVVTGSFHATCFSLIFNKNFYYILNKNYKRNSRITDLINKLGIKGNDITDEINIKEYKVNYEQVNLLKEKETKNSKEIIEKMINEWK